jgi:hypothetical protein
MSQVPADAWLAHRTRSNADRRAELRFIRFPPRKIPKIGSIPSHDWIVESQTTSFRKDDTPSSLCNRHLRESTKVPKDQTLSGPNGLLTRVDCLRLAAPANFTRAEAPALRFASQRRRLQAEPGRNDQQGRQAGGGACRCSFVRAHPPHASPPEPQSRNSELPRQCYR